MNQNETGEMMLKVEDSIGTSTVMIDGVKHVFQHCFGCENHAKLIDELYKYKNIVQRIEDVADNHTFISGFPFDSDCPPAPEHPLMRYQRKIKRIMEIINEQ